MYVLIIGVSLAIIIFILSLTVWIDNRVTFYTAFLSGTLFFAAGLFVPTVVGDCVSENCKEIIIETIQTNIISIRDDSLTSGGCFVISGYVKENPVYIYYEQEADGACVQKNVLTADSKIYEDAPENTGYIKTIKTHYEAPRAWDYNGWIFVQPPYPDWKTLNEIHIPKGSIVRQFKLE